MPLNVENIAAFRPELLYRVAFFLTRPLGVTVGDFLSKPVDHGGLAWGDNLDLDCPARDTGRVGRIPDGGRPSAAVGVAPCAATSPHWGIPASQ
jgi:hypothetical protein